MPVPNKLEQDLTNLSRELGSNYNKANSKRYKDLAKMSGVSHDDEYMEEPDNLDDYNIAGHISGNMPKEIEDDE